MPDVEPSRDPVPRRLASYPSLVDRTVLVTGGADGIGRAAVEQFALQGSRVAFIDIADDKSQQTIERCQQASVRHVPRSYHADVVDIDALQRAIGQAQRDLHGITVLVNNAANDERHSWQDLTPDYWDDRLNTNLRHYFFAIQAVAPAMIDAAHGSIINIGSSSYLRKEDVFPGYAIAKSGVEGITRTMAKTLGVHGVRVNTVSPGWVPTERQLERWWTPEGEAATMAAQSIKRRILPEEFVQLVLFLAADDGAACTAQRFVVDGGRL